MSHSDDNARAALAKCDRAPARHTGWSGALIAMLVVTGLLVAVGVTIAYQNIIKDEAVAFARDCAARGGRVQLELNLRQCIGAQQETTQNDH